MKKHCAIYTRKSHAEGLDQDFNSLDAQRESCEAFIKSQKHEGWEYKKQRYDDGAYSGGDLDRPALKQLLADIAEGKVQVIVVYKVDRLTRSLADFAKLIELFDKHDVSFVSVTQQFNTTSSMGRLTLNVLLSFAQFEREITGERIRDKLAASKQKGMWMGGVIPLGYDLDNRQLKINPEEAEKVKLIFSQYLALGNVSALKHFLDENRIVSKVRISQKGIKSGGKPISRGSLYKMLNNPVYRGMIKHRDQVYPGLHEGIISETLWVKTQNLLKENSHAAANGLRAKHPSLLAGILFDDKGNAMSPSHAVKNGKRYRYYISQAHVQQQVGKAGSLSRIPAGEIETVVIERIKVLLINSIELNNIVGNTTETESYFKTAIKLAEKLSDKTDALRDLITRIKLSKTQIVISISSSAIYKALELAPPEIDTVIEFKVKTQLKRCQGEKKFIVRDSVNESTQNTSPTLLKAITRAYVWNQMLVNEEVQSVRELAKKEGIACRYISRILPLATLPAQIIESILDGKQDPHLTLTDLIQN
ncbi:MAG: resolvase [Gammaproteobacteria bacterium]|nr:resolvase [Gammaproteobacteria bacterium]|tara:strand:+ start:6471 stop:8072 length:1602 start_codon:yes stop_codon:yes gene_type:complete